MCVYTYVSLNLCRARFDYTWTVYTTMTCLMPLDRTMLALHSGDYPALCKLHKGQGVSSAYGCLFCFLRGVYVRSGRKMLWAQFRRWLPKDHPWRRDITSFGSRETRVIPLRRTVESIKVLGTHTHYTPPPSPPRQYYNRVPDYVPTYPSS